MNGRTKYWIVILIICVVFWLNFESVISNLENLAATFSGNSGLLQAFGWNEFDLAISFGVLPILMLTAIIFSKKFIKHLSKLNNIFFVLLLIALPVFFAPFFTCYQQNRHGDMQTEKLLPPFSSSEYLLRISNGENNTSTKLFFSKLDTINGNYFVARGSKNIFISPREYKYAGNEPIIARNIHILGTDEYGRDVYSRIVFGARTSYAIGLLSVTISLLLGLILGFSAGYLGSFMDLLLSRFTEMFLAIPAIFIIILSLLLFGSSFIVIVVVLGLSGWMNVFKIVKDKTIEEKQKDYFLSAVNIGFPKRYLLMRELLPAVIPHLATAVMLQFGNVILAESALNFLGLGFSPEIASWGGLIRSGQIYISEGWWLIFFPGMAIVLSLIFINFLAKKAVTVFNPQYE